MEISPTFDSLEIKFLDSTILGEETKSWGFIGETSTIGSWIIIGNGLMRHTKAMDK